MTDWLAMGGHGAYVWSAYGLSLLVLVAVGVWPLVAMRAMLGRIRRDRHGDLPAAGVASVPGLDAGQDT